MPKSDVTLMDSGKKHPVKDKRPMCHRWSTLTWNPPKAIRRNMLWNTLSKMFALDLTVRK